MSNTNCNDYIPLQPNLINSISSQHDSSNTTSNNTALSDPNKELKDSSCSYSSPPIPRDNRVYKDKEYWNDRFLQEEKYEWLSGYDGVKSIIQKYIKKDDRILAIGVGNSDLSSDMYDDGYSDITNIDFSPIVIERQRLVMDMTQLHFPSAFDVILDKCAMDALTVNEGSPWSPSLTCRSEVDQMLTSISQALTPSGLYLQISFTQPHFRVKNYLKNNKYKWSINTDTFSVKEGGFDYFIYICKKQEDWNKEHINNEEDTSSDRIEGEGESERIKILQIELEAAMNSESDLFSIDLPT